MPLPWPLLTLRQFSLHSLPYTPSHAFTWLLSCNSAQSNWLKVGLILGTTIFLWCYHIKQHNKDVLEYKRRNGLGNTLEILI
uniref:NADH dehydrogenase [ubiquinone] 1 subunit C1, mitochondrial n=1 Tax=Castor canadensis TaxID=51338 RepID=A0A8C0WZZ1_CASCN